MRSVRKPFVVTCSSAGFERSTAACAISVEIAAHERLAAGQAHRVHLRQLAKMRSTSASVRSPCESLRHESHITQRALQVKVTV